MRSSPGSRTRSGRGLSLYQVTEPLITFYEAIMRPGSRHVQRLARPRDLLAASYDVTGCVPALLLGRGFDDSLHAGSGSRLAPVTLGDLYQR